MALDHRLGKWKSREVLGISVPAINPLGAKLGTGPEGSRYMLAPSYIQS